LAELFAIARAGSKARSSRGQDEAALNDGTSLPSRAQEVSLNYVEHGPPENGACVLLGGAPERSLVTDKKRLQR